MSKASVSTSKITTMEKETISTRLNKKTIAGLNHLARLNNSYFQDELQKILDKHLDIEISKTERSFLEGAFRIDTNPQEDHDLPF